MSEKQGDINELTKEMVDEYGRSGAVSLGVKALAVGVGALKLAGHTDGLGKLLNKSSWISAPPTVRKIPRGVFDAIFFMGYDQGRAAQMLEVIQEDKSDG